MTQTIFNQWKRPLSICNEQNSNAYCGLTIDISDKNCHMTVKTSKKKKASYGSLQ